MDTLFPAERHRRPRILAPATPAPPVARRAAARAWLDTERANLVAAAQMGENGWPGHAIRLAATLFSATSTTAAIIAEAVAINTSARRAARQHRATGPTKPPRWPA